MHIPDGYLSPATCAVFGAAMLPPWAVASARLKHLGTREVPLLALGSAFSFVVMMFNVPTPWGTGHAVGSGITAILLGPSAAIVTTTVALAIQALLFADGGVLAFGANCFNMAFLMPVVAFAVYRLLASGQPSPARRAIAAGTAGYFAINVAALATAVETGLQPLLFHAADGRPEYCPYGLGATVPGMMIPHLVIFGVVEAIATGGVVSWMARSDVAPGKASAREPRFTRAWAVLGALCLASPVGLLALAWGDAFGEWSVEKVKQDRGYAPSGLERFADFCKGLLPDYNFVGGEESGPKRALAYVVSAFLGVALAGGLVWLIARLVTRKSSRPVPPEPLAAAPAAGAPVASDDGAAPPPGPGSAA